MKLSVSRNILILVVVAVVLLAFGAMMVIFYVGAVNKTAQLEDDVKDLKFKLAQTPGFDIPGMKEQLADILEQIATEAPFPAGPFDKGSKYDNKQVTNALFEVTDDAHVTLNSLTHNKEAALKIGTGTYHTDPYSLSCSVPDIGHADRLIDLMELLEELREDEYPTLVVDSLKFQFPTESSPEVNLQFNLGIVTQKYED
jgi:flagellar basal body-associated protein FliL